MNGLSGAHYEDMLSDGIPLSKVLELAAAVAEVRGIPISDDAEPSTIRTAIPPTVPCPKGVVVPMPSPVIVRELQGAA